MSLTSRSVRIIQFLIFADKAVKNTVFIFLAIVFLVLFVPRLQWLIQREIHTEENALLALISDGTRYSTMMNVKTREM